MTITDPFAGLPLLIPVPQAAILLRISRAEAPRPTRWMWQALSRRLSRHRPSRCSKARTSVPPSVRQSSWQRPGARSRRSGKTTCQPMRRPVRPVDALRPHLP
jgi:hypothetical protein